MLKQILQGLLLIAALGIIFIVLYQLVKAVGGFFLIGLIGSLAFMEVFGIYLFFTERILYVDDLATNGIWSFTGFYIVFNILIVAGIMTKVVRSRMA
ncbi:hypothetical protein KG091_08435 [Carnobacteriaceae bacterium zg-ZUI78]|nr:hypothetical protein [Carnobacteriaceae bacterium zg-ZUI78]